MLTIQPGYDLVQPHSRRKVVSSVQKCFWLCDQLPRNTLTPANPPVDDVFLVAEMIRIELRHITAEITNPALWPSKSKHQGSANQIDSGSAKSANSGLPRS